MTEMVLPQFGMGMADGTIIAWHKAVGDVVRQGEPLCDVEAAKTTVEVSAVCDGVLQQILVPSGTNVPVNTVIAIIGDAGEGAALPVAPPVAAPPVAPEPAPPVAPEPTPPVTTTSALPAIALKPSLGLAPASAPASAPAAVRARQPERPSSGPQVEPRARRAARQHGLDLAFIHGSGPDGRIIEEDVLRAAQSAPAAAPSRVIPVAASIHAPGIMHQVRMRCDPAPLAAMLEAIGDTGGKRISARAMLVKAAALAMAEAGLAHGSIAVRSEDGGLLAIANPNGLSARAVDEGLAGTGQAADPVLVLEPLAEDGLDEIIRIDPACPASLSASAFDAAVGKAADDWRFTLTFADQAMPLGAARQFLSVLRKLLETPVAILA